MARSQTKIGVQCPHLQLQLAVKAEARAPLKLEDRIRFTGRVALKRPLQPPRREADDDVQSAEGTPGSWVSRVHFACTEVVLEVERSMDSDFCVRDTALKTILFLN